MKRTVIFVVLILSSISAIFVVWMASGENLSALYSKPIPECGVIMRNGSSSLLGYDEFKSKRPNEPWEDEVYSCFKKHFEECKDARMTIKDYSPGAENPTYYYMVANDDSACKIIVMGSYKTGHPEDDSGDLYFDEYACTKLDDITKSVDFSSCSKKQTGKLKLVD